MAARPHNRSPQKRSYHYIVSACLAGIDCTYNKTNKLKSAVKKLVDENLAIPVCPEVLGGSRIPRDPCEIQHGGGADVLAGKASVVTAAGRDTSTMLIRGARKTLAMALDYGIKHAILKSKSPSCGCGMIYDGTFTGRLIKGDGVTAALLKKHKIRIFNEKDPSLWPVPSITQR